MRVLLCKIQCPSFLCFSKPPFHIFASGSLKLENTPQVSSSTTRIVSDNDDDDDELDHYIDTDIGEGVDHVDGLLNEVKEEDSGIEEKEEGCTFEEKEEEEQYQSHEKFLKSSLKKADSADGRRMEKKKVLWVDVMGKELAEIREFESSEEDNIRYDGDKSCVCVIL